ncbi:hypothetical protein DOY81_006720 [Sarcophaga bullata]|nr:hypothetical protein DOY81_006720 [Sarcophaga bullata]
MHSSVFSNNALEYLLDIKISAVICKRQLQKEQYLLHRPYKQQSRKQQQNALQQQQQKGIIPLLLSIRQQQKPQKQRRRRLQPWQTQFLLLQKKATPTIKLKISTTATTTNHKFLHFHNIRK